LTGKLANGQLHATREGRKADGASGKKFFETNVDSFRVAARALKTVLRFQIRSQRLINYLFFTKIRGLVRFYQKRRLTNRQVVAA
jgi:hypothetical protein